MNRQIKFRGKRPINGEWIYGDLEYNVKADLARIHTYKKEGHYDRNYIVDSNTVGQFTGLYDRNGKEIYEGDILRLKENYTAVVKWNDEVGAWCMQLMFEPRVGSKPLGEWLYKEQIEILGNGHDNPDLLKEE